MNTSINAPLGPVPVLKSDCAKCAAMCCIALAMDKSEAFAIDKPAGLPCPNLVGHKCSIHKNLEWEGFKGCADYECAGAGQRITQELFAGESWKDKPLLARPMIDAFREMRLVHEFIELLLAAKGLPLPISVEAQRERLLAQLLPEAWTTDSLADFETGILPGAIRAFLASLREHIRRP
ncbi:MAG: hypothetical protein ABI459_05790 [Deltaproteobacteria bacterium]